MGNDRSNALVPTPWVPPTACRECGTVNDAATVLEPGYRRPDPGDVSICLYCRCLSVFNEDLTLREPSIDEMLKFARDLRVKTALKAMSENPFKPK
jgi:hypothetical protein